MSKKLLILLLMASMLLAACGGGNNDAAANDETAGTGASASRGEELYFKTTLGENFAPGCVTCHSLEEGVTLVGPSHYQMGARAEGVVAGESAEEYLHRSIVEPNVHITDGFAEGVMYQFYGDDLTDQEIDDLVAYLLSLN